MADAIELFAIYQHCVSQFSKEFNRSPSMIISDIQIESETNVSEFNSLLSTGICFDAPRLRIHKDYLSDANNILKFAALKAFLPPNYRSSREIILFLFMTMFSGKRNSSIINKFVGDATEEINGIYSTIFGQAEPNFQKRMLGTFQRIGLPTIFNEFLTISAAQIQLNQLTISFLFFCF